MRTPVGVRRPGFSAPRGPKRMSFMGIMSKNVERSASFAGENRKRRACFWSLYETRASNLPADADARARRSDARAITPTRSVSSAQVEIVDQPAGQKSRHEWNGDSSSREMRFQLRRLPSSERLHRTIFWSLIWIPISHIVLEIAARSLGLIDRFTPTTPWKWDIN